MIPRLKRYGDFIDLLDAPHFKLLGRTDDMVDIAGKRGSLDEIDKVLQAFSGLLDGVIFCPQQERSVPRLVAVVVLKPTSSKTELVHHLRQFLDPVFLPRPLFEVQALPREDNGKLPKKVLLDFYQTLLSAGPALQRP